MGIFGCDYLEDRGTFFHDYYCTFSNTHLGSNKVSAICATGRYHDCEDFRDANRCFITTAVCTALGKPNDCEELMLLREFRDGWLSRTEEGRDLISEYKRIAPVIVATIDKKPERLEIYRTLYDDYILPCVRLIREKEFVRCKELYTEMVEKLARI